MTRPISRTSRFARPALPMVLAATGLTVAGTFATPVQLSATANTDVAITPIAGNASYRWFGFFIDGQGSEALTHS